MTTARPKQPQWVMLFLGTSALLLVLLAMAGLSWLPASTHPVFGAVVSYQRSDDDGGWRTLLLIKLDSGPQARSQSATMLRFDMERELRSRKMKLVSSVSAGTGL